MISLMSITAKQKKASTVYNGKSKHLQYFTLSSNRDNIVDTLTYTNSSKKRLLAPASYLLFELNVDISNCVKLVGATVLKGREKK